MGWTPGRVSKFLVAATGAAVLALQAALTDGHVSANEAVGIALAVLVALGVYAVPNTAPVPYVGNDAGD